MTNTLIQEKLQKEETVSIKNATSGRKSNSSAKRNGSQPSAQSSQKKGSAR